MTDIGVPFQTFAAGRGQAEVAALIGVTQGSVSQMLSSGRSIWVRQMADGTYKAYELREIGRKQRPARAA
ncbi:Cro/CI family transcriptional regulator [Pseudomonas nitroreducens]|uniref:Cro/CI family transcriptional regulator n=1 Tax=Pseudomonas nitroreducens TaxID=46680 RepID=UPI0026581970|nr:Cro/CI family transcriptional regulator [Pseudomonas nitroreducens]MCP1646973.1 putative transcriptional regulator [Pseudomonas nitroreducens]MCP1685549.1 putative transcriptional regulator [Pseudomonas nitroreducens]